MRSSFLALHLFHRTMMSVSANEVSSFSALAPQQGRASRETTEQAERLANLLA